jgi:hypothetical protein
MDVLRTRYQDRVARLQRRAKSSNRRRRRVSIEVRIERRKLRQLAIDGHVNRIRRAWCERIDERSIRGDAGSFLKP